MGGIRDDLGPGTIVPIEDHLNLTGRTPLVGPEFVDLVDAYSPQLREIALSSPDPAGGVLAQESGVYAQLPGPSSRPRPTSRMLRTMGADVVGMSMALETIAARAAGVEVLGLAVVTNPAAAARVPMSEGAAIAAVGAAPPPPWPPSCATS